MEASLDRELDFHLAMQVEQFMARGMDSQAARTAALRLFGGVTQTKEDVRGSWGARQIDAVVQDVRVGVRSLRRTPGYVLVVVMAFALGIGATTAAFSLVYGVLLQGLPYAHAERLAVLQQTLNDERHTDISVAPTEIRDYLALAHSIDRIVEYHSMQFNVLGGPTPERLQVGVVSVDYFDVLGVRPALGHLFTPDEEHATQGAVLLLSDEYWRRAFQSDPTVIGRSLTLNDRPHQVVGVLPVLPSLPDRNDVYMPTSACPFRAQPEMETSRTDGRMLTAVVRFRAGVRLGEAQVDIAQAAAQMVAAHPEDYARAGVLRAVLSPVTDAVVREARSLALLSGIVVAVLLIVCANVAGLTLARWLKRVREVEMRARLGATRTRLVRQFATESLLLAAVGGLAGLVATASSLSALRLLAERFSPRAAEIGIHPPVLGFALGATLLAGFAAGIAPVLLLGRRRGVTLSEGITPGPRAARVRHILLFGQVAVSVVLLAVAGVMLRSVARLNHVDPGFDTEHVLALHVSFDWKKYWQDGTRRSVADAYLASVRSQSGVTDAALSGQALPLQMGAGRSLVLIEGRPAVTGVPITADVSLVTPSYFSVMGMPMRAGRTFDADEGSGDEGTRRVAVVNATMAWRHWTGSPLGHRFTQDGGQTWIEVIGVVADARQEISQAPGEQYYLPWRRIAPVTSTLVVRTASDPHAILRAVERAVWSVDADQPLSEARTLGEVKSASFAPARLLAWLLSVCGALALAIVVTGIGGLLAFSVSQRAREFGIRLVLGATRRELATMVVRQGLTPVQAGLVTGLAGALVIVPLAARNLYETSPTDPLILLAVACLVQTSAIGACLLPARRAASNDPATVLRDA
jgi:putative ABC transport system permease protein